MDMDLRQISLNYDAEQDRLRLRLLSASSSQTQVWLTRRLMMRLWPVLRQAVAQHGTFPLPSDAIPTPEARHMLQESARSEAVQRADFSQPYAAAQATEHPLGTAPLLAVQVNLTPLPAGRWRLGFRDPARQGFQIELPPDLMHVLMHLLEKALRASEWGVLEGAAGGDAEAEEAVPPSPALLN